MGEELTRIRIIDHARPDLGKEYMARWDGTAWDVEDIDPLDDKWGVVYKWEAVVVEDTDA